MNMKKLWYKLLGKKDDFRQQSFVKQSGLRPYNR